MPIEITMPRLSDTMEEGTLIKWHVKAGDQVASGDVLADVETDKATMELQTYDDGTVASLAAGEGQTLAVGELILLLAEEGEDVQQAAGAAPASAATAEASSAAPAPAAPPDTAASVAHADPPAPPADGERRRFSPVARKIAEEHGLDPASLVGSGPDGRVIKRDVLAAIEGAAPPAAPGTPQAPPREAAPPASASLQSRTVTLSTMRKAIARRLLESKTTIPHYTVTLTVLMDPLMALRKTINEQLEAEGVKLSVNDFIVKATALSLVRHPMINSSWAADGVHLFGQVNVGVAVALPTAEDGSGGGLVVPVIRDANEKTLRRINADTKAVAKKARSGGLSSQDMADGTFTVSNLGMYGVEHFEAIINPPQAAILAVGGAIRKALVRDGQVVVGHEMSCTLSADHRIVDGAMAAEFLQTLRGYLESPAAMLV